MRCRSRSGTRSRRACNEQNTADDREVRRQEPGGAAPGRAAARSCASSRGRCWTPATRRRETSTSLSAKSADFKKIYEPWQKNSATIEPVVPRRREDAGPHRFASRARAHPPSARRRSEFATEGWKESHGDRGIGARVPRKEDARHLHGRGSFVSDMMLPGQSEVAFLRSPVAHGRIRGIGKPAGSRGRSFTRADLAAKDDRRADDGAEATSSPRSRRSRTTRCASSARRSPCASRRRAPRPRTSLEQIELDIDELPVLVDAHAARAETAGARARGLGGQRLPHAHARERLRAGGKKARRRRQARDRALAPGDGADGRQGGAGLLGRPRRPAHRLHLDPGAARRSASASRRFLGIDQGQVRVISPDVGGGFGYKGVVQPEELCVAWLALKIPPAVPLYRGSARAPRRRRQLPPAPLPAHRLCERARPAAGARRGGHDRRRRLFELAVHGRPRARTGDRQPARPLRFPRLSLQDLLRRDEQAGLPALSRRRAHRRLLRDGADDRRDRARGGARAVGGAARQPRAPGAMPYDNVTRKHYDSGDYPQSLRMAREKIDLDEVARAAEAGRAGRPPDRHRLCDLLRAVGARHQRVRRAGACRSSPATTRRRCAVTPDGGLEVRVGVHSHGQGMETTLAQIAHEVLGIDIARIQVVHGDTGATPYSTGTYASRSIVMAGGAVANACKALVPRFVRIGAHLMQCAGGRVPLENGEGRRPQRGGSAARHRGGLVPAPGPAAARRRSRRARRRPSASSRSSTPAPSATPRMPRRSRSTPRSATSRSSTT